MSTIGAEVPGSLGNTGVDDRMSQSDMPSRLPQDTETGRPYNLNNAAIIVLGKCTATSMLVELSMKKNTNYGLGRN